MNEVESARKILTKVLGCSVHSHWPDDRHRRYVGHRQILKFFSRNDLRAILDSTSGKSGKGVQANKRRNVNVLPCNPSFGL